MKHGIVILAGLLLSMGARGQTMPYRGGTGVVQVYVRKVNDADGPLKTLRGFQRVEVAAGKTREATVTLPPAAFGFFDRAGGVMTTTPGE